jgi:hypothetical protein
MKRHSRRSAWLSFVACGLMGTAVCRAEVLHKPVLSISMASAAAEAELEKRGLAKGHSIASVSLSLSGKGAYYVAHIEPPIPAQSGLERGAGKMAAQLVFKIDMSGIVTSGEILPGNRARPTLFS